MKKYLIAIVLSVFLFQTDLSAQIFGSDNSSKFRLGLVAGYNQATANDLISNNIEFDGLNGFHAGISSDIQLVKIFSLEPVLLVNRKGFEVVTDGKPIESYKLDYVSLQLIAKLHLTSMIKILVGAESSVLAAVRSGSTNLLDSEFFNNGDYSLLAGLEIALFKKWSLHAKYNSSFSSLTSFINTDEVGNPIGESNFKNRVVMVGATFYPFRIDFN